MSAPATVEDIARLERSVAEMKNLIAMVLPLAVRQKSRARQARAAGLSVRTLQRRERQLSAKLRVEGVR